MDNTDDKVNEGQQGIPLTRREWLLSLGSAVVLSGYSGAPEDGLAAQATTSGSTALPPGLYAPSLDHMTHALMMDQPFVPIPPGAETEYVRPRSGPFVPQAFTQQEYPIIRRLVEIILGQDLKSPADTAVPGGPASIYDEVAEWIDLVVESGPAVRAQALELPADQRAVAVGFFGSEEPLVALETFEPDRICHEGLKWLGEESQRRFTKSFLEAGPASQIELVTSISDAPADQSAANAGTRFYHFLKAESIRGFYTSRRGLKELDYKGNAFYAESPGCTLKPSP